MNAGPAAAPGTLYLVPTPIGNIRDLSPRAADVLGAVAVIAAEDTRKAQTLLRALGIRARLVSYYDYNERTRSAQLLRSLRDGKDVALISDAGTPMVSDPGYRLIRAALDDGIRVRPLPGPSAAITALVGSGLPCHRFEFVGFLPRAKAERRAAITELSGSRATLVVFESPHRLADTVADLSDLLGDRQAALARDLTKDSESYLRGSLAEVAAEIAAELGTAGTIRGEYTLVVAGAGAEPAGADDEAGRLARALLRRGVPARTVREVVAELTGLGRNAAYQVVCRAADDASAG